VFLEGANNALAEGRIRGLTLQGAYCDELTLFPEQFFSMLLSRLRVSGAKLFATTNPDNPNHWLKKRYLDRAADLDLLSAGFTIDDNTFLPADYVANLKKEYTGVFFDRFILGRWVAGQGVIYGMFDKSHIVKIVPKLSSGAIGIDYGQSNATVFLFAGIGADGRLYVVSEYYHRGRDSRSHKSPAAYSRDFIAWAKNQNCPIDYIYYDPAATGFKDQLAEMGVYGLRAANNAVLEGIQLVSSLFGQGLIRISGQCENLIKELYSYSWDEKAANQGEDKPKKQGDHCVDALRYLVMGQKSYWKSRLGAEN
jgi:PBSX family phage terminase large subunit